MSQCCRVTHSSGNKLTLAFLVVDIKIKRFQRPLRATHITAYPCDLEVCSFGKKEVACVCFVFVFCFFANADSFIHKLGRQEYAPSLSICFECFFCSVGLKSKKQMSQVWPCSTCHRRVFPGAHLEDGPVNIPAVGALTAS